MSETTYGFRKAVFASGVLVGLGSAVLLGKAVEDHHDAQPHTTVTSHHFSGPITSELCVKPKVEGEKPDCTSGYTANITDASSTLTVHHNYNQQLDDQAGLEAIVAGLGLIASGTLGYRSIRQDPSQPTENI